MAAWRASTMTRLIVAFLYFSNVLGIKVTISGSSHVCVSGSQVLHVNFGASPIQQCGLLNTTPQASKDGTHADGKKANEQAKATPSPGSFPSKNIFTSSHISVCDVYKFIKSLPEQRIYLLNSVSNKCPLVIVPLVTSRKGSVEIFPLSVQYLSDGYMRCMLVKYRIISLFTHFMFSSLDILSVNFV